MAQQGAVQSINAGHAVIMSACLQAALVAELLALGNQVDTMQTQQQLRLVDTSHTSSSPSAWLSLTPKIQQAQEEVQASSGSASAVARLC